MEHIYLGFDRSLFSKEAKENTQNRIDKALEEWKEYRDWELDGGVFEYGNYKDMIVLRGIEFMSFCEHHLFPIIGRAHIAYIPGGVIVGLSKMARVVKKFASRPQLQERMTAQIADYLQEKIPKVKGVMVVVEARHSCMRWRGVREGATTITSALRGAFEDNSIKEEALVLMGFGGVNREL